MELPSEASLRTWPNSIRDVRQAVAADIECDPNPNAASLVGVLRAGDQDRTANPAAPSPSPAPSPLRKRGEGQNPENAIPRAIVEMFTEKRSGRIDPCSDPLSRPGLNP